MSVWLWPANGDSPPPGTWGGGVGGAGWAECRGHTSDTPGGQLEAGVGDKAQTPVLNGAVYPKPTPPASFLCPSEGPEGVPMPSAPQHAVTCIKLSQRRLF